MKRKRYQILLIILILLFVILVLKTKSYAVTLYIYASSEMPTQKTEEIGIKEEGMNKEIIKDRTVYKNFKWSTSDPNVVTVSVSQQQSNVKVPGPAGSNASPMLETVKVTAQGGGTATITAQFEDWSTGTKREQTLTKTITVKATNVSGGNSLPSNTANAVEIFNFILTNANNVKQGKTDYFELASLGQLEAWKTTMENYVSTLDEKAKNAYNLQIEKLDLRIKELKGEDTGGKTSKSMNDSIIKAYEQGYNVSISPEGSQSRDSFDFVDVLEDTQSYVPTDSNDGGAELTEKANLILSVITSVGIIIAVIMPAILGIKYMLGSVEEKAEYKKDMVPYLVGAVLLFAITVIVKVLQQFGQSINDA